MKKILTILILLSVFFPFEEAKAQNWNCYSTCMQTEKYPAVCNKKCARIRQQQEEKRNRHNNSARNNLSESSNRENYNISCYRKCISRGKLSRVCKNDCSGDGIENDSEEYEEFEENSSTRDGNYRDKPYRGSKNNDFSDIDFQCFKACRSSGEAYEVCQDICRP